MKTARIMDVEATSSLVGRYVRFGRGGAALKVADVQVLALGWPPMIMPTMPVRITYVGGRRTLRRMGDSVTIFECEPTAASGRKARAA